MVNSTSQPKVTWDYTEHASHYEEGAWTTPTMRIRNLLKAIGCTPSKPVAEIGAGTGKLTKELLSHGLTILSRRAKRRDADNWNPKYQGQVRSHGLLAQVRRQDC